LFILHPSSFILHPFPYWLRRDSNPQHLSF
jgi:hypothetical protein